MPMYPDPINRPPHKLTEIAMQEVPRCLSDFDPEINTDFEENSPLQEGVISEHIKDQVSHNSSNHKDWLV